MSSARKRRAPGRPAGGSEEIVQTILGATLNQLGEGGYARLSVEEIAAAVGVNKTSIYRRWPTKAELVLAAIDATHDDGPRFRETGNLRADLVALLRGKAARLSTPKGRAIARALLSVEGDEELAATIRCRRYCLPVSIVQAAIDRGELAAGADAAFVSELLLAPLLHRLLVTSERVNRVFLENVVDHVLAGLAPPVKMQRPLHSRRTAKPAPPSGTRAAGARSARVTSRRSPR